MSQRMNTDRRTLIRNLVIGLSLAPLSTTTRSADIPLLEESDPAATALHYVEDASRASDAQSGTNCSNCSLYSGTNGAAQGPCTLFPGKQVKAAGWCSAWTNM
jgi:High potential iron-sulfur protein